MGEEDHAATRGEEAKKFFIKWHLPMMFVFVLVVGYLRPHPGAVLRDADLGGICFNVQGNDEPTCVYDTIANLCVTLIFIMSGMKLKTDEIKAAFKVWPAGLFGIVSILLISPLLTFWIITWNFKIEEFAIGLSLFFSQATTLSSGPIIAAQAKGNVALALLLTVSTNIMAVLTMPLFVVRFLNQIERETPTNSTTSEPDENESDGFEIEVNPVPIILQLFFLIIIPLAFGKFLRFSQRVCDFVVAHKQFMKLFSSSLLAVIVWMNISGSADDLKSIDAGSIIATIFAGIGLHFILLLFNYSVTTYIFRMKQREKRSVVILTSQKTLPVALTVLELLDEELIGSKSLVAIPIIAAHFVQIVIDAFLAASWGERPLDDEEEIRFDESEDQKEEISRQVENGDNVCKTAKDELADPVGPAADGSVTLT